MEAHEDRHFRVERCHRLVNQAKSKMFLPLHWSLGLDFVIYWLLNVGFVQRERLHLNRAHCMICIDLFHGF